MSQITQRRKTRNLYQHAIDQPAAGPAYRSNISVQSARRKRGRPAYLTTTNAPFGLPAPDYKPHITTQEAPLRPRRLVHNIYTRATFTAAVAAPDARPHILIQSARPPRRRRVFMILKQPVAQATVVAPDRRPQIFIQLAPRGRRPTGVVVQSTVAQQPVAGWRRPFIQTARSMRRAGRVIVGRIIRFTPAGGGANPPVTCATTITLNNGRTNIRGMEATTVTASTAHTTINPMASITTANPTASRTDADCG